MDQGNRPLIDAEVDVLVTFLVNPTEDPGIDQKILCYPKPYAMMRRHHPLDRDRAPVMLSELSKFPQLFIRTDPRWTCSQACTATRIWPPHYSMVANISTSAQAIIGVSDSVSLRIVRPAHNCSPLGHELAFAPVADYRNTAGLAICSVKPKHGPKSANVRELLEVCRQLILDGSMENLLFYGQADLA